MTHESRATTSAMISLHAYLGGLLANSRIYRQATDESQVEVCEGASQGEGKEGAMQLNPWYFGFHHSDELFRLRPTLRSVLSSISLSPKHLIYKLPIFQSMSSHGENGVLTDQCLPSTYWPIGKAMVKSGETSAGYQISSVYRDFGLSIHELYNSSQLTTSPAGAHATISYVVTFAMQPYPKYVQQVQIIYLQIFSPALFCK